jgi:hypothetical protein
LTFEETVLFVKALMDAGLSPNIRVCIPYDGALHTKLLEMGYRVVLEETAWNSVEMVVVKF